MYTSGLGCALCVVVMFLIDIKNNCVLALATCFIGFLLYKCASWCWADGCVGCWWCAATEGAWLQLQCRVWAGVTNDLSRGVSACATDVEKKKPPVNWGDASAARR